MKLQTNNWNALLMLLQLISEHQKGENVEEKRKRKQKNERIRKTTRKRRRPKRVKFNLKNNEYYTITPKNRIKKNKRKQTRKKRK